MSTSLTGNSSEDFATLVYRLVRLVDIFIDLLGINLNQCVVHPAVVPSQPVADCYPQLTEWLKVFHQFVHLVKLSQAGRPHAG